MVPETTALLLGYQVTNHTIFTQAFTGSHRLETMTAAGILSFATVFGSFAIRVTLAGMNTVTMHLVAGGYRSTVAAFGCGRSQHGSTQGNQCSSTGQ